MNKINLVFIVFLVLLISGCASKRFYKKAEKFDQAGLYTDAAALYYQSALRNSNNIDAKLGLQRTGQMVLDDKILVFKNHYNNGMADEAVHAYLAAEKYHKKVFNIGIKLIFPEEEKAYYNEVKDEFLNNKYQEATKALGLEKFSTAERLYTDILEVDDSYKDSKSKWIIAKYEPIFRKGNEQFNIRLFRSAYYSFDKIIRGVGVYKNSMALKSNALDSAMLTIVCSTVGFSESQYGVVANQLKAKAIDRIHTINSPFYKLVSESTIVSIPNWTLLKGPSDAFQQAKKYKSEFEAKAVLGITLNQLTLHTGKMKKVTKRAYLKQAKTVINETTKEKETSITYKKVEYVEYSKENRASLKASFELSRIDKDELAFSSTFNKEAVDNVHYATFDGNYKNLVPGYWEFKSKNSPKDKRDSSKSNKSKLHALFRQSKEVKHVNKLQENLLNACSYKIVNQIKNYKPEN